MLHMGRMSHPIHKVSAFQIVGPYRLRVTFTDGVSRTIDFEPILRGEMYGPLKDLNLFNAVMIDPEVHTLVWPNGADFDPATLHDWPEHEAAMQKAAKNWTRIEQTP